MLPAVGKIGRGFSLIHVRDVAAALCAAGEAEGVDGMAFNIASETRSSLLDLSRLRARLLGRGRGSVGVPVPAAALSALLSLRGAVRHRREAGGFPPRSYAPGYSHGSVFLGGPLYATQEAATRLGFRAKIAIEAGLAELLSV